MSGVMARVYLALLGTNSAAEATSHPAMQGIAYPYGAQVSFLQALAMTVRINPSSPKLKLVSTLGDRRWFTLSLSLPRLVDEKRFRVLRI